MAKLWHVIFSNPCCEFRAEMGLQAKGFETCLPTFSKLVRSGRQERAVERALFPRYLFVHIPQTDGLDFERLRQTDGVETLVRWAGSLATVTDEIVRELQKLDSSGAMDDARLVPPSWQTGDTAQIYQGPLAKMIVRIKELTDSERADCVFELINSDRVVNIPLENLVPYEYA